MTRDFGEFQSAFEPSQRGRVEFPAAEEEESPTKILQQMLAAIAEDRFADLGAWLADDVEMDIHGFTAMRGAWRGRTEVLAAIERNFRQLTEQRPVVRQMVTNGPVIAMLMEEGGRIAATRERYAVRGMMWYEFAGGKLKRFEEYLLPVPVLPEGNS